MRLKIFTCAIPALILLSLCVRYCCAFQIGKPQIRVFTTTEIGCEGRTFMVAKDGEGLIYLANPDDEAVFIFDGANWFSIDLPGALAVVADQSGVVWVAGDRCLGRLEKDAWGQVKYVPLEVDFRETDVQNFPFAFRFDNGLRFGNTRICIQVDLSGSVSIIRANENESIIDFECSDLIVVNELTGKLGILTPEGTTLNQEMNFLDSSVIPKTVVQLDERNIVVSGDCWNEFWVKDDAGDVKPFSPVLLEQKDELNVSWLTRMSGNRVGVGSNLGFHFFDSGGKLICSFDEEVIQSGESGRFGQFLDGQVWLGLEYGFAIVDFGRPGSLLRHHPIQGQSKLITYDFTVADNHLLLATDHGFSKLDYASPTSEVAPNRHKELSNATTVLNTPEAILFGGQNGIYEFREGDKPIKLVDSSASVFSNFRSGIFAASMEFGRVEVFRYESGDLIKLAKFDVPMEPVEIYQDTDGSFWIWEYERFSHVQFNEGWDQPPAMTSGETVDLLCALSIEGELFNVTMSGIRRPVIKDGEYVCESDDRFSALDSMFENRGIGRALECGDEGLMLFDPFMATLHRKQADGRYDPKPIGQWATHFFGYLSPVWDAENKLAWIDGDKVMVSIDVTDPRGISQNSPVVRLVESSDLAAENGDDFNQSGELRLKANGGVSFDYALPFEFGEKKIEYQYRLKGLEDWSDWTTETSKEYMRLPGGKFRFEVRKHDPEFGFQKVSSPWFYVNAPWYSRPIAWVGFVFAGFMSIVGLVAWRTRSLAANNQKMEKLVEERTAEVERQKAEIEEKTELLVQQYKNAESDRLKSFDTLVAGIAHDFNNLLTVISMSNEIIGLDAKGIMAKAAENSQNAVEAASELCRELSSISDSTPMSSRKVSAKKMIQEMTPVLKSSIPPETQINFLLDEDEAIVDVEPGQLKRAILNLVVNAGEVAERSIRIRLSKRTLTERELDSARFLESPPVAGDYVCIDVEDDGPGVDDEALTRLFDPFFTTKRLGRGLGLSIVMRIIARHQGIVIVEPVDPKGTRFRICLPAFVSTSMTTIVESLRATVNPLKLLVVDDDPFVLQSVTQKLMLEGHQVLSANSGSEGLDLFQSEEFDVIVADISMPEMTGVEMAEVVLDKAPSQQILFVSGYSSQAIPSEILERPNVDFLRKPFLMKQFNQKIAKLIQNAQDTSVPR